VLATLSRSHPPRLENQSLALEGIDDHEGHPEREKQELVKSFFIDPPQGARPPRQAES
jgi:hypothetical protein